MAAGLERTTTGLTTTGGRKEAMKRKDIPFKLYFEKLESDPR